MRLALAQINTVVGDLDGNRERIVSRIGEAREAGADLVLFPEPSPVIRRRTCSSGQSSSARRGAALT